MNSYHISKKAIQDINEIWMYTFEVWSSQQADFYYSQIFKEIENIVKYPLSGKIYDHVKKDYRMFPVKSHLIFYKVNENKKIQIMRILHKSRDVKKSI